MSENSLELINEYKDQIRILRQEVAELQDAGKSKDAANKRCLQKLEHTNQDLEEAIKKIKKLEEKNDQKDIGKDKNVFWTVPAAAVMVHKFVDPCRREYIWYKGHTDF